MTYKLTDLDGVGPARSDSLVEAGYESVDAIANADPEELAEAADVPEDTALDFVVQSQNLIESEEVEEEVEEAEEEETLEPKDLAQPEEEKEASEEDEEEPVETISEVIELTVNLDSDIHYDAYMTALLNGYERRVNSNQQALDAIAKCLNDARYNTGEVTHDLTPFELNTMHAAVTQQQNDYKGQNMIDHMDAMRDIVSQVNEVRDKELF